MDANIKLLTEQALAFAYETCRELGHKVGSVDQIFIAAVMGKYTELVVKQCARISNYAYDGCEYPGKMIKEYFGVE